MRNIILSILLLTIINLGVAPVDASGDTKLTVGIPATNPKNAPSTESISTSVIDPVLYIAGLPANYTRNKANAAFSDLNGLKADLRNALSAALTSSSKVKRGRSLTLSINPVDAVFTQQGTSIGVELGQFDLSGTVDINKSIPLCGTPKGTFEVENIRVLASYDAYTGNIHGANAFYTIKETDVDCDNFIGDAILALAAVFTEVDGQIDQAIEDFFDDISGSANAQSLFSVKAFLDGLREYDNNTPLSGYGDKAIDAAQNLIESTNLNSGLQLNVSLYDGNNNEVKFIASHQTVDVTLLEYTTSKVSVDFTRPAGTSYVEIYSCTNNRSSCGKMATSYFGNTILIGSVAKGSEIVAIGYNSLIGGLPSLPGKSRRTIWDFNCQFTSSNCPDIP